MVNVTTGKVRLSYVTFETPRLSPDAAPDAKPKYSVMLIIPKTDKVTMKALRQAEKVAYDEGVSSKWGGRKPRVESTIHDGDEPKKSGDPYGPECAGSWVLNASSVRPPRVVDKNRQPMDVSKVKSGDYARVALNSFPFSGLANGVTFGLEAVQFLEEGEPLGGGISVMDAFDDAYSDEGGDDFDDYDDAEDGMLG